MSQPNWKLIANLGDVSPLEYGGYFVYEDITGVYAPEAEVLLLNNEEAENSTFTVYRFSLDRLKDVEGFIVPVTYEPTWKYHVSEYVEWFVKYLSEIADSSGISESELISDLCSENIITRAWAYHSVGEYFGWYEFDSYPLKLTLDEAKKRYDSDHCPI